MNRKLYMFSALFFIAAGFCLHAQAAEPTLDNMRRRNLVLDINSRILENEKTVVWSENHRRAAIPGNPVGIQIVGSNIVISVQFTPFVRRNGNVLVAQGQIWVENPGTGVSYYTTIQTIPMEFGEPIYFFPLGQNRQLDSSLEIIVTVNLFNENNAGTAENSR